MNITVRPVAPQSVLGSLNSDGIVNRPDTVLTPLSTTQPADQSNPLMTESFEKVLSKALEPVNNLQLQSADLDSQLAQGKLENVDQAMVLTQKANLSLDLTMQIRNNIVNAYQDIMRTQV